MFGNILNQIEASQKKIQEQLAAEKILVTDPDQKVSIEIDGNGVVKDLFIEPSIFTSDNKEMIEDLLVEYLNRAYKSAKQKQTDTSKESMGSMLPPGLGLENLFGQ